MRLRRKHDNLPGSAGGFMYDPVQSHTPSGEITAPDLKACSYLALSTDEAVVVHGFSVARNQPLCRLRMAKSRHETCQHPRR